MWKLIELLALPLSRFSNKTLFRAALFVAALLIVAKCALL